VDPGECALAPPDRGPYRTDDDRVPHCYSSVACVADATPSQISRDMLARMELRHSAMPEGPRPPRLRPADPGAEPPDAPTTEPPDAPTAEPPDAPTAEPPDAPTAEPGEPVPAQVAYRVDRRLTALRAAGVLIFALVAVFRTDPTILTFAVVAAAVLAAYTVRDLVAPVRLAADADGVTVVAGFAGRRRIPWSEIDRVRVDERRRLGTRSELLEVDTGEQLYLFSSYDLGAPCWEVTRTLGRMHGPTQRRADR
jgi:hypothetical protein